MRRGNRSPGRAEPSGRGARPSDLLALWGPALAVFALHFAFATTYGIFRDEMYYLSCARRLAWGYVDHPPLVAALTWLWTAVAGDGLRALRVLPALAVAGATALAGSTARAMGGGRFAVALAGFAMGLAPVVLSLASVLSMNAFDLLFWAAIFRVLVALLDDGDERLWLAFGALAGLGLLNKISVLFLGFGVLAGLLVARRWEVLRGRWFWIGGAVAVLLFAPHLVWQQIHGWPTLEFMENARRDKNIDYGTADFLREQLLQTGPVNALVWLAGLLALLAQQNLRRFRALAFAYLAILAVMLSTAAKPYYLAPAYAVLWAAGAVAIERATLGWRSRAAFRVAAVLLLVGSALAIAPLARPMLPVETYVRYAAALGQKPGTDEHHELGRLKQFYADMQEWREMAVAVGEATSKLSPEERPRACVFGQNYGEAGTVERFGAELDLPPAISAHNSWFLWGPGECLDAPVLLVIDRDREDLDELFGSVEPGATFDCRDCMPYEDGLSVWIVREPKVRLEELWPRIKNFT
jgi:hypothetical protein